jgi:hypothetical protein
MRWISRLELGTAGSVEILRFGNLRDQPRTCSARDRNHQEFLLLESFCGGARERLVRTDLPDVEGDRTRRIGRSHCPGIRRFRVMADGIPQPAGWSGTA